MYAYLTIVRYPAITAWAGFLSMAYFRLPLASNKKGRFYKLMGCGKNGTFDKTPDFRQWALLMTTTGIDDLSADGETINYKALYGGFIAGWWRFFRVRTWTLVLQPVEGHGTWDGKEVFGPLPRNSGYDGMLAVLTRATIRLNRLKQFWKHVDGVAKCMASSKGLIASLGVGEVPWIKQATVSIWEDKESMKAFSYRMREHTEVIRKTREEKWYSEDMFVRFKIIASIGKINEHSPLNERLRA